MAKTVDFYHGTATRNAASIRKNGLRPSIGQTSGLDFARPKKRVYLASTRENAKFYAQGPGGVELVDIDIKKEKQLNVWLNNKSAQGTFARDAFFDVLRTGIELEDVGLTVTDLRDEFGELPSDLFAKAAEIAKPVAQPQASAPAPEVTRVAPVEPAETPAPAPKQTKPAAMDPDDFVLVCFASGDEKCAWLKSKHMPEGIKTMAIEEIMQVELG